MYRSKFQKILLSVIFTLSAIQRREVEIKFWMLFSETVLVKIENSICLKIFVSKLLNLFLQIPKIF